MVDPDPEPEPEVPSVDYLKIWEGIIPDWDKSYFVNSSKYGDQEYNIEKNNCWGVFYTHDSTDAHVKNYTENKYEDYKVNDILVSHGAVDITSKSYFTNINAIPLKITDKITATTNVDNRNLVPQYLPLSNNDEETIAFYHKILPDWTKKSTLVVTKTEGKKKYHEISDFGWVLINGIHDDSNDYLNYAILTDNTNSFEVDLCFVVKKKTEYNENPYKSECTILIPVKPGDYILFPFEKFSATIFPIQSNDSEIKKIWHKMLPNWSKPLHKEDILKEQNYTVEDNSWLFAFHDKNIYDFNDESYTTGFHSVVINGDYSIATTVSRRYSCYKESLLIPVKKGSVITSADYINSCIYPILGV